MRAHQGARIGSAFSWMACIMALLLQANGIRLLQFHSGANRSQYPNLYRSSSARSEPIASIRMPQRAMSLPSSMLSMSSLGSPNSSRSHLVKVFLRERSSSQKSSLVSPFRGRSHLLESMDLFNLDSSRLSVTGDDSDKNSDAGSAESSPKSPPAEEEEFDEDFSVDCVFPEEKDMSEFRDSNVKNDPQSYHIPSGPVIVAPGYGGSRLEARLTEPSKSRRSCGRKYSWFGIWINLSLIFNIDCMFYAMRLQFDPKTNTTYDSPGIEVRVQKDKIDKVEALHSLPMTEFSYFAPIIKRLVSSLGYTREISIRGAPYDFRKAPNELHKYYSSLKKTIKQLYITNGHKRVTLICHSMGCSVILYFLQRMSQIWKDFYIQRLISLAAPWGGAMGAIKAAFFGDNLGAPLLLDEAKMNKLQRSLPATMFLFPKEYVFKDRPLIRTNIDPVLHVAAASSQNYTLNDVESLFKFANYMDGYKIYLNTKDLLGDFDPPNVEVWCLVGKGFNTLSQYNFGASFPHSPREELYEDGDKTVLLESASYCRSWSGRQTQAVHYKDFAGVDHMQILRDTKVLEYIQRILDIDLVNDISNTE